MTTSNYNISMHSIYIHIRFPIVELKMLLFFSNFKISCVHAHKILCTRVNKTTPLKISSITNLWQEVINLRTSYKFAYRLVPVGQSTRSSVWPVRWSPWQHEGDSPHCWGTLLSWYMTTGAPSGKPCCREFSENINSNSIIIYNTN